MKKFLSKQIEKQHGPVYGLLAVVISVAAFLCFLVALTVIVRFVMS